MEPPTSEPTRLRELASVFLRLGATSFGGPAAHIAMMEEELVRRRRWLGHERFLDLLSVTQLLPGPTSTELALHIGWERRRGPGLVVAGVAFILPAMLMTGALGWAYLAYGELPALDGLLRGVKPVILAVVLQAILGLAPHATRGPKQRILWLAAIVAAAAGAHELLVLLGAGLIGLVLAGGRAGVLPSVPPVPLPLWPLVTAPAAAATGVTLGGIFWVFLKTGGLLFGSGYVLLAFLRADLVERLGWLSESQLVDAIAVGQVTPGPLLTSGTFIGYLLAGPLGALTATFAIFLPAFMFSAFSGPLVTRIRRSRRASGFLDAVNAASLALMVVVTAQIGDSALIGWASVALAIMSAFLLVFLRVRATWLVLGGALVGLIWL